MAGWYGQHGGAEARYAIHISVHSGEVKRGGSLAVGVGDRSQVIGDRRHVTHDT